MLRRRSGVGELTGDEVAGDLEVLGVLALHQEEGDGRGSATGSPFDSEFPTSLENLVARWCDEHIEAGDLSKDAGGGGQCQKAGLGE